MICSSHHCNKPLAKGYPCESCREASRKWRRDNFKHWKELQKRSYFKQKYGITPEEYERLLESQGYRCALCRVDDPGGRYAVFCVDHDHRTKKVRGLLCDRCNRGLGFFEDDPKLLLLAISYLRSNDGQSQGEHDASRTDSARSGRERN